MDSAEQANGEKRVKRLLIEPLKRRGLAKPGGLTKDGFQDMQDDLCAKLAYMSELNLAALEEEVAKSPGGKEKDRFPIANVIYEKAAVIQPPGDDASPLIRAVFAHALGQDAIAEGWAPELLKDLRSNRRFPKAYAVSQIKAQADDAVRRMINLDAIMVRGDDLTPEAAQWRSRRVAMLDKCRRIADLANTGFGE